MKIGILCNLEKNKIRTHPLYPIYRWKHELKNAGFTFKISSNLTTDFSDCQIVITFNKYFKKLYKSDYREELKKNLLQLKEKGSSVILYDSGDSTDSTQLKFLPYVDVLLKKQLYKDMNMYLSDENKLVRIWSQELASIGPYSTIKKKEDLEKIKLGWNIGLVDYSSFNNLFFKNPKPEIPSLRRKIDSSFRGQMKFRLDLSFQRDKTVEVLRKFSKYNFITGEKVNRSQYLKELKNSKVCISPFGWGEICYRDFEIFICGSILLKPSMEHLVTFPAYYYPNETYIPLNWDLSDLEDKIEWILTNYEENLYIAKNGQQLFFERLNDKKGFVRHFTSIIENAMN